MPSLGPFAKEASSLMGSSFEDMEMSRWDSRIIVSTMGSETGDSATSTVTVGVELRGVTGMVLGDMAGETGNLPGT